MAVPVSYLQTDSRWKNVDYSAKGESTTIGKAGCGPSCMAMVIASLVDRNVTPITTAKWSLLNGYKACKQGTYYTYFVPQGRTYGVALSRINTANIYGSNSSVAKDTFRKIESALRAGKWIIACMGRGNWTSSGHFVLAYSLQGNTVYIRDPNSTKTSRTQADKNLWESQIKYAWIVETGANSGGDEEEVTQQQFNQMMDNYLAELAKQEPNEWSEESRKWAEKNGVITGDTNGNKQYKSFCTREQMVTLLKRIVETFG